MKKIPVMIFLILVILAGIFYISLQLEIADFKIFSFQEKENQDYAPPKNAGDEPDETGLVRNTQSPGLENGLLQGGGGGEETTPGCILRQVSYSLKKFEKTSVCNEFDVESCIDKTVTCALEVKNFDTEISGTFAISFVFIDEAEENLDTITDSHDLLPEQALEFSAQFNIQGEKANEDITCSFNSAQIPTKEICGEIQESPTEEGEG